MIDLRSDTVTKPTDEMRQLMANADVGDDVYGEDPTVNELEAYAAEMLGKEAGLFVTSGTQGNQAAILAHTRPGQEVIMDDESHVFLYEGAAAAAFAGVQSRTLPHDRGQIDLEQLEAAIRPEDVHFPETGLIWLENTHNRSGGSVLPLSYMMQVQQIAEKHNIPVHVDGARLFNAAVANNVSVKELSACADSVQFCLSKGLGAPIGSMLVGDKSFIDTARKKRKMLGGGLRQVGVIAAPALHSLKTSIYRLAEDHEHAKMLAKAFEDHTKLALINDVETNILYVDTTPTNKNADEWLELLKEHDIHANAFTSTTIRFVTHRDISKDDIEKVINTLKQIES
ncbi:low-specificity L-threonine aldolase [Bacillus shivajii]|uniref:low-specificity L-threonine aldolase n=1 Tax=Bacillus shivajii TaxID=1983719 RepID=UPI001CFA9E84|nr:low-specificity L-threonine aldolase [Bacillus shivajii]UCZ52369.1 low-specificity L-threonine aldolase [Bacillus shivajii]